MSIRTAVHASMKNDACTKIVGTSAAMKTVETDAAVIGCAGNFERHASMASVAKATADAIAGRANKDERPKQSASIDVRLSGLGSSASLLRPARPYPGHTELPVLSEKRNGILVLFDAVEHRFDRSAQHRFGGSVEMYFARCETAGLATH